MVLLGLHCGWHMRCIVIRGDAWPVLLSPCTTPRGSYCFTGQGNGLARLADGSADAGGAWEYGRLEVLINGVYTILVDRGLISPIGRRGAQVACRSLGYATGAQLHVGNSSPLPGPPGSFTLSDRIVCNGSESSLSGCDIIFPDVDYSGDYSDGVRPFAVNLICSGPSGVVCIQHACCAVV